MTLKQARHAELAYKAHARLGAACTLKATATVRLPWQSAAKARTWSYPKEPVQTRVRV